MNVKAKKRLSSPAIIAITLAVAIIVAATLYFVGSLAAFDFDIGLWNATRTAGKYLNALENTRYRSAFSCLYLYEGTTDTPYDGNKNEAYSLWKQRVESYTEIEVYLSDWFNLSVQRDENGNMYGTVVVSIYNQGKTDTYQTDIVFVGNENTWKIADITTETVKSFYETAVSGNMN